MFVLGMKTKFHDVSLLNMQAPTEENGQIEKEDFYQKTEELYDSCPSNDVQIVLVDLSAKPGWEEVYRRLTGRHIMHLNANNNYCLTASANYNWQKLLDFAAAKSVALSSTCSPHKHEDPQTEKPNNQIDHTLTHKRNANSMLDK
jgi:hypothetical protein